MTDFDYSGVAAEIAASGTIQQHNCLMKSLILCIQVQLPRSPPQEPFHSTCRDSSKPPSPTPIRMVRNLIKNVKKKKETGCRYSIFHIIQWELCISSIFHVIQWNLRLRSFSGGGRYGRTNVRTDGRTSGNSPLCPTGHRPKRYKRLAVVTSVFSRLKKKRDSH